MVNKTISLSFEIFEKLKGEENASNLIDSLLRKHYGGDPDAIKAEIMRLQVCNKALQGDLQAIEAKEAEAQKTLISKLLLRATAEKLNLGMIEKKRIESPERKEKLKEIMKDAWKAWDSPAEEFEKFYENFEKGLFKNIAGYCEANGIKKKEKVK